MRLWHKDLISFLPRQQLLGQWREISAIYKSIIESGTPNHILVNKIINYKLSHFGKYVSLINLEMKRRNYRINSDKFKEILDYCSDNSDDVILDISDLFYDWHNKIYLRQCLYNLEEKYMCGGITDLEWSQIRNKFGNIFELV